MMKSSMLPMGLALCLLVLVLAPAAEAHNKPPRRPRQALAVMTTGGFGVEGYVLFTQQETGPCIVEAHLTGLTPGKHGWHVHEFGNLTQACNSTGGHYNPTEAVHGNINTVPSHVGDLANLEADASGNVDTVVYANRLRLTGGRSIIGRAVTIHSGVDDLGLGGAPTSLINGNSGGRIACGIIGVLDG
eukprot:jgi/Chlat1/140/Chrsp1S03230